MHVTLCHPCWYFSAKIQQPFTPGHDILKNWVKKLSRFRKFYFCDYGVPISIKIGPSIPNHLLAKWMCTPTLVSIGPKIVQKHSFFFVNVFSIFPKKRVSIQFWWTRSWYFPSRLFPKICLKTHLKSGPSFSNTRFFLINGIFIRREIWL